MKAEVQEAKGSPWEPTRYQKLFRYAPSGTIFARFKIAGKQVRRSLKTPNLELAQRKLAELERQERNVAEEHRRGKMLFGEALDLHVQSVQNDPTIKPSTRAYYDQRVKALRESWPGLDGLDIRRITKEQCEEWAKKFAAQFSASSYNHSISLLKHAFEKAMEAGVRYDNPARKLERRSEIPKKLNLPSAKQFIAFLSEIDNGGSGKSKPCANLVRFLAFSGCRKMEAARVTWTDVDFDSGRLSVLGDPEHGTKNGEWRSVPMVPEMRQLLLRLKTENPTAKPEDPVMTVRECQKAMNRAAKIVGMSRITHHDLRHLFATRCIESGVDIPTVSRWLGHKDGGVLAMRLYGHLRDEHSDSMAQKVSFGTAPSTGDG